MERFGTQISGAATEVLHHEATLTLNTMFRGQQTEQEVLKRFFKWMVPFWHFFKCRFRPDGTMTFKEFEKYVHWDWHFAGDCQQVFKLLDKDDKGFISVGECLQGKRWYEHVRDMGEFDLTQFRRMFADHYGNLGLAWRLALDPEDRGFCCFNVFARECHKLGLKKSLRSTWNSLTDNDPQRPIRLQDLDPFGDSLVSNFAVALTLQYGSLRDGWDQIVRDGGGRLKRSEFIERCEKLGINVDQAKWLFSVLDKNKTRCLTAFDKLTFLSHWDPGRLENTDASQSPGSPTQRMNRAIQSAARQSHVTEFKAFKGDGSAKNPFENNPDFEPFNLEIVLSKEEHQEYLKRSFAKALIMGIDVKGEQKWRETQNTKKLKELEDLSARWNEIVYRPPESV